TQMQQLMFHGSQAHSMTLLQQHKSQIRPLHSTALLQQHKTQNRPHHPTKLLQQLPQSYTGVAQTPTTDRDAIAIIDIGTNPARSTPLAVAAELARPIHFK